MAENDSHYNQTTNTSGSGDNGINNLDINVPWTPDNNQSSDTDASDRRSPFPPTTPPGGGRPPEGNRPPGNWPSGNRPPGNRPPGNRPPGNRPPGGWQPGGNITPPIFPLPPAPPFGDQQNPGWNNGSSTFPSFPTQSYGQVRFLNASTNTFDVDITVDGNPYVMNSRFGNYSGYDWISDGFHTVTVRRSSSIRTILYQQNLPFTAGQKVTMVLVDSAMGGLDMVRVIDTGCSNLPQTTGCYRFANMTHTGSNYDLQLGNGETIFRNVGYQKVTPYKQAMAGTYQFNVTNAHFQITMRELPIIIIGASGTGTGTRETVLSYMAAIEPRRNYTTYMIGNSWSDHSLRAITLED